LKGFVKHQKIELYPQKRRKIRLPFGKWQDCLDYEYRHLEKWQEKLYWFNKLDSFDIRSVKEHQLELPYDTVINTGTSLILPGQNNGCFIQGAELFEHGLQAFSTRNESQYKVIYYLWRNGVELSETIRRTWAWIQKKNNGFSKDIIKNPSRVKYEISYQATFVYNNYDLAKVYPDATHNNHNGYICKPDLEAVIGITEGSLPRMRFLYNLVKYSYPRRHRRYLNVHSDRFIRWGNQRTYKKYLNELDEKGVIKRGTSYSVERFSKSLKLNWDYKSSSEAVMFEGRSVGNFDAATRLLYQPSDLRALIRKAGASNRMASHIAKQIF